MVVDYLSDLHIDYYFPKATQEEDVINFWKGLLKEKEPGDVLVIAGDIGHSNSQNIKVLKYIKKNFYKNIICVLGNHDYYISAGKANNKYKDSFQRVKEMQDLINSQEGMYCLNGNTIEINGIKFGGCNGWYSEDYLVKKYPMRGSNRDLTNDLWKKCMNDPRFIYGVINFDDIFGIEKPKIEKVYKECDVMITHINPSIKDEYLNPFYQGSSSNVFFTFDGDEYLKNGSMKYWVFGHVHSETAYIEHNVNCLCNPLGYPFESMNAELGKINSFEII